MEDPSSFAVQYTDAQQQRIAFAWNGKHAAEFTDANQEFRWAVVAYCIGNPSAAPLSLLVHLFLADAQWSVQAWGAPNHFAALAALMLERGGPSALEPFSVGLVSSFDTFGACQSMSIAPEALESLSQAIISMLKVETNATAVKRLSAVQELFSKLRTKTASQGWVTLSPGTPVSNVRVVWPRWHQRLWRWLRSALGNGAI